MPSECGKSEITLEATDNVSTSSFDVTHCGEDSYLSSNSDPMSSNNGIWFSQETWCNHRNDLQQIRYTIQSISHSLLSRRINHEPLKCLLLKALRRIDKFSRLLEIRSCTMPDGCGLVFNVSLRGISLKTYKEWWRHLIENITQILDSQNLHEVKPGDGPSAIYIGLESQFLCLIKFKEITQSRCSSPWQVHELSPNRLVILFELIRMDLKDKLTKLNSFFKESKSTHNKSAHGLSALAKTIDERLNNMDLLMWIDLDYYICKTKLLLAKVLFMPLNPNESVRFKRFHDTTVRVWLEYVKCLGHLIAPIYHADIHKT